MIYTKTDGIIISSQPRVVTYHFKLYARFKIYMIELFKFFNNNIYENWVLKQTNIHRKEQLGDVHFINHNQHKLHTSRSNTNIELVAS